MPRSTTRIRASRTTRPLRFNAGVRYVETTQTIDDFVSVGDPRSIGTDPRQRRSRTLTARDRWRHRCRALQRGRWRRTACAIRTSLNFAATPRPPTKNWLPSASAAFQIDGFRRRALGLEDDDPAQSQRDAAGRSTSQAPRPTSARSATRRSIRSSRSISTSAWSTTPGAKELIAVAAFRKSITGFTANRQRRLPVQRSSRVRRESSTRLAPDTADRRSTPVPAGPSVCTQADVAGQKIVLTQQVNAERQADRQRPRVPGRAAARLRHRSLFNYCGLGIQGNLTIIDQKG